MKSVRMKVASVVLLTSWCCIAISVSQYTFYNNQYRQDTKHWELILALLFFVLLLLMRQSRTNSSASTTNTTPFCPTGQTQCGTDLTCYFDVERCDTVIDCTNAADELGCLTGGCNENQILCTDGNGCYSPSQRCDSNNDCTDASDEAGC